MSNKEIIRKQIAVVADLIERIELLEKDIKSCKENCNKKIYVKKIMLETSPSKTPVVKKPLSKKIAPKKVIAKKPVPQKTVVKKPLPVKVIVKKPVPQKTVVKKELPKKVTPKKPVPKKVIAKKPIPKKVVVKKPVQKKTVTKKPLPKKVAPEKLIVKKKLTLDEIKKRDYKRLTLKAKAIKVSSSGKAVTIADIKKLKLIDLYGVGPKIEEYFIKNGITDITKVSQKNPSTLTKKFVEELPALKWFTPQMKFEKIYDIVEEAKFIIKDLTKK